MKYVCLCIPLFFATTPIPSYAINEDACAIWLCLPAGFPSGCSGAHSEFVKRLRHFKPPLPSLSSCLVSPDLPSNSGSGSDISSSSAYAAYVPSYKTCTKYKKQWGSETCTQYSRIPPRVFLNTRCIAGNKNRKRSPSKCTLTLQYITTYMDGEQFGETYYWYGYGTEFVPPEGTEYVYQ